MMAGLGAEGGAEAEGWWWEREPRTGMGARTREPPPSEMMRAKLLRASWARTSKWSSWRWRSSQASVMRWRRASASSRASSARSARASDSWMARWAASETEALGEEDLGKTASWRSRESRRLFAAASSLWRDSFSR